MSLIAGSQRQVRAVRLLTSHKIRRAASNII